MLPKRAWVHAYQEGKTCATHAGAAAAPSWLRAFLPPCLCTLLTFALLAGCQAARVERPLTAELGGNDPEEQLEFWHRLAEQPVASNDDAFHGLLLFLDGDDPADGYSGRVQSLRRRGMLPRGFHEPADRAVERGTLAVALLKALDIEGGLMLRLLGPTPRYAVRELVYLGLYPQSSPRQTFSGTEFLGIIGKAEDHQRRERASARARRAGEAEERGLPTRAAARSRTGRPRRGRSRRRGG